MRATSTEQAAGIRSAENSVCLDGFQRGTLKVVKHRSQTGWSISEAKIKQTGGKKRGSVAFKH